MSESTDQRIQRGQRTVITSYSIHYTKLYELSTVHSSKGLEWPAVLIMDLVDDRFPSRHALARPEDLEEERRLLYVACTRAKDHLSLLVPGTVYNRGGGGSQPAMPSLFVRNNFV